MPEYRGQQQSPPPSSRTGPMLPPLSKYYYGPAQGWSSTDSSPSHNGMQLHSAASVYTNILDLHSILLELKQSRHTADLTTSSISWAANLYVTPVDEPFPLFGRIIARMALPWSSALSSTSKSTRQRTPHFSWSSSNACHQPLACQL